MRKIFALGLAVLPAVACAPVQTEFVPSTRSAVELRAIQSRVVQSDPVTVLRGVAGTLHDLGYRITRADAESGTISGTRATTLRVVFVVQPRGTGESVVRANATVLSAHREGQVDSAEFYARNLFEPLAAFMHREFASLPDGVDAPDAGRPVAELNTAAEREAAARAAVAARSGATPAATPAATPTDRNPR
ncbi:MAG: hypothetical protein K2X11_10765 [Acetobacteraceae bacterium]|nr:hypothetical protein [Acetobacteraceae bacterium]